MAYSDDLRQKVLQAVNTQPLSKAALARTFGVSLSYLKGIVRRQKAGNPHALPPAGGPPPKLEAAQRAQLRQYVLTNADATLAELQTWLQTTCQVTLSVATVCRVLQRMDLPRKKRHCTLPNATPPRSSRNEKRGRAKSRRSIPPIWSWSTKAG